ncbi:MAG: ABC transporter substrate-binding protein [Crocinitomicaceae bacterium]|nr:ABC transporter substrate-binding protein [Crocinitomicaceae bacterium]
MTRIWWIFLLFLYGCSNEITADVETSKEFIEIPIEYAEHFKLNVTDDGYELIILNPNTGEIDEQFIIDPTIDRKIIGLTTTLNGMLNALSASDQLVGVTSMQYVYDSEIIERFNKNEITEFGDETTFSVEKIIASTANTIFYSGFGDDFPHRDKLEKFNFSIFPIYDWREQHPLGKAEWIKVVGILVNREQEALDYFATIEQEYLRISAIAQSANTRPSVVSGGVYGDIWFAPSGDSYMAKLINDAGANYVYHDQEGTGSIERSIEQILLDNQHTNFWINPGFMTKASVLETNPHSDHLEAFDNVYCYSPNINKFWENGAIEPHLVLSDLIHIFHPEIAEIDSFHFYEKID